VCGRMRLPMPAIGTIIFISEVGWKVFSDLLRALLNLARFGWAIRCHKDGPEPRPVYS
jgi:hypothetical protein